jgi:hypothetical protein
MPSHTVRSVSTAAQEQAQKLVPYLAEMIEQNDPALAGLDFNAVEARSAAIGDLVGRVLLRQVLDKNGLLAPQEEQAVRQAALAKAAPQFAQGLEPAHLKVVVQRDKLRTLKTARGPVPVPRDYWYFPELHVGIFPPRLET